MCDLINDFYCSNDCYELKGKKYHLLVQFNVIQLFLGGKNAINRN